jgi:chromosomal replication initiation ATPase DnaA
MKKLEKILKKIANKTNVEISDIKSDSRKANIVLARQLFCYVSDKEWDTDLNSTNKLIAIGEQINRKRSNIIHSINVIENLLLQKKYNYLKKILNYDTTRN